jgi:hypothetical protein
MTKKPDGGKFVQLYYLQILLKIIVEKTKKMESVLRIRIRDPVPFLPQCPRSGMGKKSRSGPVMNILETFFGVKIFKFFDANPDPRSENLFVF